MPLLIGSRVVRGPDWKWRNQDGGDGNVGTIIKKYSGNTGSEVEVCWDNGAAFDNDAANKYRAGPHAYDLRLLDNGPTGVIHDGIQCNDCKARLIGIRWKCSRCFGYDLCHTCYMSEQHDTGHRFWRIETPKSAKVKVTERSSAKQTSSRGILRGSTVMRGRDWRSGNEDGGRGKLGSVLRLTDWNDQSARSAAEVKWPSGKTGIYRIGHEGKVDLMVTKAESGCCYYASHLALLGQRANLCKGDRVRLELSAEDLEKYQNNLTDWPKEFARCLQQTGTITQISEAKKIHAEFDNGQKFIFNSAKHLSKLFPGDDGFCKAPERRPEATGCSQSNSSRGNSTSRAQSSEHPQATGCSQSNSSRGISTRRAQSSKQSFRENFFDSMLDPDMFQSMQTSLNLLTSVKQDYDAANKKPTGIGDCILKITTKLLTDGSIHAVNSDDIVQQAGNGNHASVQRLLQTYPNSVNCQVKDRTALQLACHNGHVEVVNVLLSHKAKTDIKSKNGNDALNFAILGNKTEIVKLLLERGVEVNALNKGGSSTLLMATGKGNTEIVKMLLYHNANPNFQDAKSGNTALHRAIIKKANNIASLLISSRTIDLSRRNKEGLEPLHLAAKQDNSIIAKRILTKEPRTGSSKTDGQTAMHLAAGHGHAMVLETLITHGDNDIDMMQTYDNRTPLHVAAELAQGRSIGVLLRNGATVDMMDKDGNTPLHLVLLKCTCCPDLEDKDRRVEIACRLIRYGAGTDHKNKSGQSPMDIATEIRVEGALQQECTNLAAAAPVAGRMSGILCTCCKERPADVRFEPCQHKTVCTLCLERGQVKECRICKLPAKPDADTRVKFALTTLRNDLVDNVNLQDGCLNHLIQGRVLTQRMQDEITLNASNPKQVERLVDYLHKRPAQDTETFIDALFQNNQGHMGQKILNELEKLSKQF